MNKKVFKKSNTVRRNLKNAYIKLFKNIFRIFMKVIYAAKFHMSSKLHGNDN